MPKKKKTEIEKPGKKPAPRKLSRKSPRKSFFKRHPALSRIFFYLPAALVILIFCADLSLRFILPRAAVKEYLVSAASRALNARLSIDKIDAGLYGAALGGVKLSAEDGEEILSAKNVTVTLSLPALFKKRLIVRHIIVDGVTVNIVREKNGSFNFEKILPSEAGIKTEEEPAASKPPVSFLVRTARVDAGAVNFTDRAAGLTARVKNLGVIARDINPEEPFEIAVTAAADAKYDGIKIDNFKAGLSLEADFAGGDFERASVNVKNAVFSLKNAALFANGVARNFIKPVITFNVKAKRLLSADFKEFFDGPEFDLSSLAAEGRAAADPETGRVRVENFKASTVFAELSAAGFADTDKPVYDIKTSGAVFLDKLPKALPMAAEYNPSGVLKWDFDIKDGNLSGVARLADTGAFIPAAGALSGLNSEIKISSLRKIDVPDLHGKLNGHTFNSKLNYLLGKNEGSVNVRFDARRVYIKTPPELLKEMTAKNGAPSEPSPGFQEMQKSLNEKLALPPFKIQAYFDVKSLDAPFIGAEDVKLKADLSDATVMLDSLGGRLAFSSVNGRIKDIHALAGSNGLTRILFLSVGVVSRVINSLNVVGVLKGIVSAQKSNPETEEEPGAEEPEEHKLDGKMDFDKFATEVDFKSGKAEIKRGTFVAPLMSFALSGYMDFNTRVLNMSVNAAPGRHKEDGIMPLTVKISGTIDEPKGSMSVISSIGSLFTKTLFNNPAVNAFKSGILGVNPDKEEVKEFKEAEQEDNQ